MRYAIATFIARPQPGIQSTLRLASSPFRWEQYSTERSRASTKGAQFENLFLGRGNRRLRNRFRTAALIEGCAQHRIAPEGR